MPPGYLKNGITKPPSPDLAPVRNFKSDSIDKQVLQSVVQMAEYAPTGHNSRNVEIVAIQNKAMISELSKLTAEGIEKFLGYTKNPIGRFFMKRSIGGQFYQVWNLRDAFQMVIDEVSKGRDMVFHNAPTVMAFTSSPRKTSNAANSQLAMQNALLSCERSG